MFQGANGSGVPLERSGGKGIHLKDFKIHVWVISRKTSPWILPVPGLDEFLGHATLEARHPGLVPADSG